EDTALSALTPSKTLLLSPWSGRPPQATSLVPNCQITRSGVCAKTSRSKRAMLFGIVSPIRPLLMTLIVALDLSLESSRRITSGYVAADLSTQSPTVDDNPIATIFSGPPEFKRAAVRGNCAPSETLKFAERHLSADDNSHCAGEGALPDNPISKAAPIDAIIRAVRVGGA